MKRKLEKVRKEKEEETELFNKKVEELQEKFLEVEEMVKLKDLRIEELKKKCHFVYVIEMKMKSDLDFSPGHGPGACN